GDVAERVVDILEMIEIEIKHGKRLGAAAGGCKCSAESVHKSPAVGEPGQRVQSCQVGYFLIHPHHVRSMAPRRRDICDNDACDDEPENQYDPCAIVIRYQRA